MKYFLSGAVLISVVATIGAFLIPVHPQLKVQTQVLGSSTSINIDEYLQTKLPDIKPAQNFSEIVAATSSGFTKRIYAASGSAEVESATPSSSSSKTVSLPAKLNYTVVLLGDSMFDTMGNFSYLAADLKSRNPASSFKLLNYGVGASNMDYAMVRLTNSYNYLGKDFPSVISQNPDILVLESFAYNHWDNTQSDLDRQWLTIARIIETTKRLSPNTRIVLTAAIAPYCPTYTDGSANLPPERKYPECATVKAYLQNMVNFAISQKYPLADAYHASLSGSDGRPQYINSGDHIHTSDEGRKLMSAKIADAIGSLFKVNTN
jgi:hypothetical protein